MQQIGQILPHFIYRNEVGHGDIRCRTSLAICAEKKRLSASWRRHDRDPLSEYVEMQFRHSSDQSEVKFRQFRGQPWMSVTGRSLRPDQQTTEATYPCDMRTMNRSRIES
jgi:hypothetical protein